MSYSNDVYYSVEPYTGDIICHTGKKGMKWGYSLGQLVDNAKTAVGKLNSAGQYIYDRARSGQLGSRTINNTRTAVGNAANYAGAVGRNIANSRAMYDAKKKVRNTVDSVRNTVGNAMNNARATGIVLKTKGKKLLNDLTGKTARDKADLDAKNSQWITDNASRTKSTSSANKKAADARVAGLDAKYKALQNKKAKDEKVKYLNDAQNKKAKGERVKYLNNVSNRKVKGERDRYASKIGKDYDYIRSLTDEDWYNAGLDPKIARRKTLNGRTSQLSKGMQNAFAQAKRIERQNQLGTIYNSIRDMSDKDLYDLGLDPNTSKKKALNGRTANDAIKALRNLESQRQRDEYLNKRYANRK